MVFGWREKIREKDSDPEISSTTVSVSRVPVMIESCRHDRGAAIENEHNIHDTYTKQVT